MANEESKKAYEALDCNLIEEKSGEIMMEILMEDNPVEKEIEIFESVKAKFTYDELVYIACLRIGVRTKQVLDQTPGMASVIKMARELKKKTQL